MFPYVDQVEENEQDWSMSTSLPFWAVAIGCGLRNQGKIRKINYLLLSTRPSRLSQRWIIEAKIFSHSFVHATNSYWHLLHAWLWENHELTRFQGTTQVTLTKKKHLPPKKVSCKVWKHNVKNPVHLFTSCGLTSLLIHIFHAGYKLFVIFFLPQSSFIHNLLSSTPIVPSPNARIFLVMLKVY